MKHKEKRKHLEKKYLEQPAKKSRGTRGKLDLQDAVQGRAKVLAPTRGHKVADNSSSSSEDFSYEDKFLDAELQNSPEDAPETREVDPSSSLEAGEVFSASEHLSFVSSSSEHILVDQDGPGSSKVLLNQDLMEKNFSFMLHLHLPSLSTSIPSVSAVSSGKKRVMNVYYKPVPMKRSVAALEDTEEDLEPPAKMIRIGRITCPDRILPKASLSCRYLGDVLTDGENGLDREGQEEREEAEKPPKDLAQEAGPSTETPARLEDLYSGFRCMGCGQVFPNLQMLKKHLEHGVEEGASCLSLAFAKLRDKEKKIKRITRRENSDITTSGGDMEILLRFLLLLAFCSFLFYYYNRK